MLKKTFNIPDRSLDNRDETPSSEEQLKEPISSAETQQHQNEPDKSEATESEQADQLPVNIPDTAPVVIPLALQPTTEQQTVEPETHEQVVEDHTQQSGAEAEDTEARDRDTEKELESDKTQQQIVESEAPIPAFTLVTIPALTMPPKSAEEPLPIKTPELPESLQTNETPKSPDKTPEPVATLKKRSIKPVKIEKSEGGVKRIGLPRLVGAIVAVAYIALHYASSGSGLNDSLSRHVFTNATDFCPIELPHEEITAQNYKYFSPVKDSPYAQPKDHTTQFIEVPLGFQPKTSSGIQELLTPATPAPKISLDLPAPIQRLKIAPPPLETAPPPSVDETATSYENLQNIIKWLRHCCSRTQEEGSVSIQKEGDVSKKKNQQSPLMIGAPPSQSDSISAANGLKMGFCVAPSQSGCATASNPSEKYSNSLVVPVSPPIPRQDDSVCSVEQPAMMEENQPQVFTPPDIGSHPGSTIDTSENQHVDVVNKNDICPPGENVTNLHQSQVSTLPLGFGNKEDICPLGENVTNKKEGGQNDPKQVSIGDGETHASGQTSVFYGTMIAGVAALLSYLKLKKQPRKL